MTSPPANVKTFVSYPKPQSIAIGAEKDPAARYPVFQIQRQFSKQKGMARLLHRSALISALTDSLQNRRLTFFGRGPRRFLAIDRQTGVWDWEESTGKADYAALSFCLGGSQVIISLMATIDAFL